MEAIGLLNKQSALKRLFELSMDETTVENWVEL